VREGLVAKLSFEKISRFDRVLEPVTVSIPFKRGALADAGLLVVREGGRLLVTQKRVLGYWGDGSVKWLLVHMQVDLPGNKGHVLEFGVEKGKADAFPHPHPGRLTEGEEIRKEAESRARVSIAEGPGGLVVNTGPLEFTVARDGFYPLRHVRLEGVEQPEGFGGFELACDVGEGTTLGPVELEIEEAGPLKAVINVRGSHWTREGAATMGLRGRITAYAGKAYVEVEHQFVHAMAQAEIQMRSLKLAYVPGDSMAVRLALGEGFFNTNFKESDQKVEMALTADVLLYQPVEHFTESFYGDFWVDRSTERGGLAVSIYQAHQNFPKKLEASGEAVTAWLWPDDVAPARVLRGMAKTHRMLLHFHGAMTPSKVKHEVGVRSLQFQMPDVPTLEREWWRENNPWGDRFFPERVSGKLLSYLGMLHDNKPSALGMFHFGDMPDGDYTDQGRGKGETVWANNEYDRPHACALFYGLTGERRALDASLVAARHWLDVDFCHFDPDPLIHGGLRIHDRYHATGKVVPSHEWVDGFLDYYFFTGRAEGLAAARSVGENVMRQLREPWLAEPGAASVRENGWALRAMVGMWIGTGEEKWRQEALRLVELFLGWVKAYDGLLAPYTYHSMPRVVFMIALTVNSLARYLLIDDDVRVKGLIVRTMDDLLENCMGPDGIFYYKELPSLRIFAPTAHAIEALTHAYRCTGEARYLKIAARQFAALEGLPISAGGGRKYIDASGAVVRGEGNGRAFAEKYTSLMLFAGEAGPLGLLDWYEYPFYEER
jgi:hypothetical protein